MIDRQFDHIIKNKLSGVKTNTTPDWELFAQKQREATEGVSSQANEPSSRAKESTKAQAFDTEIVATLESYEHKSTAPNWDAFSKLKATADAQASIVDKENETFDVGVKSILTNHQASKQPNWDAFKNYKNKNTLEIDPEQNSISSDSTLDEAAFDSQVQQTLEGYSTSASPQWALLSELKKTADADAKELDLHRDFDEAVRAGVLAFTIDPSIPLSTPQWSQYQDYNSILTDGDVSEERQDAFDQKVTEVLDGYTTSSQPDWSAFSKKKSLVDQDVIALKKQKDFDEAIRAGITAFSLDPSAPLSQPQWLTFLDSKAQLEQNLDNDTFDNDLKVEVDNYISPEAPQWSTFIQDRPRLEANYDIADFDNKIRERVEGHTTKTSPQWAKFKKDKKRKDKAAADGQFDKGLAGSLDKLKVRYNSEHWLLLRSRLQKVAQLRKHIFTYKSLEIIFMALIFLTFANFFGPLMDKMGGDDISSVQTVDNTARALDESLKANDRTRNADPNENINSNNDATINTESVVGVSKESAVSSLDSDRESNQNVYQSDIKTLKGQTSTESTSTAADITATSNLTNDNASGTRNEGDINTENEINNSKSQSDISDNSNTPSLSSGSDTVDKSNLDAAVLASATEPIEESNDAISRGLMNSLESIDRGGITFLNKNNKRTTRQPSLPVYIDLSAKKKYLDEGSWIHLFAGVDNNYIRTPLLEAQRTADFSTNDKNGYNFEAIYSRMKGQWEVETGLSYNYVNYTPFVETPITYNNVVLREVTFSQVRLDMIAVPTRFKYHFVSNGRWSVFGHAGLINELILKTGYSIDDNPKPEPIGSQVPSNLPEFYESEFTKGLFGDLPQSPQFVDYTAKNNIYILRGQLGIGAERNINDNLAAYLRADYTHTLHNFDIGPLNDRINKVALGMGFKYRLK